MRTAVFLLFLTILHHAAAQGRVMINEVQPANHATFVDDRGHSPDWIELYNPGPGPARLEGMRLVTSGRIHPIEVPLTIPPEGHLLLYCTGHPGRGPDHIGFTLPRSGGTLLLIDTNGTSIVDLFTWPAMESDLSIGRSPDGDREWSYFERPTPGSANWSGVPVRIRTPPPQAHLDSTTAQEQKWVRLEFDEGTEVRYTLDGSRPTLSHGQTYEGPFPVERNTSLRAAAWRNGELPSKELFLRAGGGRPGHPALHVAIDPEDLHGPRGIDDAGGLANHTRMGKDWERPVQVEVRMDGNTSLPAGMRVHGSGSRGYAKRSFKLVARDRYDSPGTGFHFPDGTHFQEGVLRADAGPHAFLRNRFIETIVQRHGLNVDVQPSTPVDLYVNGDYRGLYRWMPPKDAEWARHVLRAEAVDVLEGPAGVALSGSRKHFERAQEALLSKASLDSLDVLIDTRSLIDMACIDLWTGRADHDINVRCHRPRQPGGRWRWVLFDLDLWTPPEENSVERMCSATVPECPYLPYLLDQPELQMRLLARITTLQATAFHQTAARTMVDSIHRAHLEELQADHQRWEQVLEGSGPGASLHALERHITERPVHLFEHLAERTGRNVRRITVEVPSTDLGQVLLEDMALQPGRQEILCFSGVPLRLKAEPATGVEFAGWKGTEENAPLLVFDPARTRVLKPALRSVVP